MHSWTDVGSPAYSLFTRITTSMITITSLTSSLKNLVFTSGSFSTTYTCATTASPITIVASATSTQNYDLATSAGTTSYTVPAFTLSPSGSTGTISYTDVTPITGITFNSMTRTYDWSALTSTGSYTLTMQGSLTGSTSVTSSFTIIIARTLVVASSAIAQSYDMGTFTGTTSYTVPAFTTNPTGQESSIVYTDVSVGKPAAVTLSGRTYTWSAVTTPIVLTLTLQG